MAARSAAAPVAAAVVAVVDAMMALGCLKPIPRCLLFGGPPTSDAERGYAAKVFGVACFQFHVGLAVERGGWGAIEVVQLSDIE